MILVLAEKPSAKKNFATALGGTAGRYNGEEYKISPSEGNALRFRVQRLAFQMGLP